MPLKNKLDAWLLVKTSAVWMAVLYVICAVAFLLLQTSTFDILWKPMFHAFGTKSVSNIIIGFLETVIYTSLAVWLFVAIYNQLSKR